MKDMAHANAENVNATGIMLESIVTMRKPSTAKVVMARYVQVSFYSHSFTITSFRHEGYFGYGKYYSNVDTYNQCMFDSRKW